MAVSRRSRIHLLSSVLMGGHWISLISKPLFTELFLENDVVLYGVFVSLLFCFIGLGKFTSCFILLLLRLFVTKLVFSGQHVKAEISKPVPGFPHMDQDLAVNHTVNFFKN